MNWLFSFEKEVREGEEGRASLPGKETPISHERMLLTSSSLRASASQDKLGGEREREEKSERNDRKRKREGGERDFDSLLTCACHSQVYCGERNGDEFLKNLPLTVPLLSHQRDAVQWMRKREVNVKMDENNLYFTSPSSRRITQAPLL